MDPLVLSHLTRWQQFRASRQLLESSEPVDLLVLSIVSFYAALHLVQAYLLTKGERFDASNHWQRWRALKAATELRLLLDPYKRLRTLSESARYDPSWAPPGALREDTALALNQIERILRGKMIARGYPLEE